MMKKFNCKNKKISNITYATEQAILYDDGHVEVGIDLWRKLDPVDFPSYKVKTYPSLQELQQDYAIPDFGGQAKNGFYTKRDVKKSQNTPDNSALKKMLYIYENS